MRSTFAPLALAALAAANPVPQGVTEQIKPEGATPAGCSPNYDGTFQITVVNVTQNARRSFEKRQDDILTLTLKDGVLKDAKDRTGYIAANRQFQFDGPPQTGAIYTAGWSVCQNGSIAIGDDAIFQQCLSGTFYNLYDENSAPQCSPVYIEVLGGGKPNSGAGVQPDGQPTSGPGVSQIGDGQIQAPTGGAVTQIGDGQIQAPTGAPVSQIGDGQIQAPTGAPVSQIGDGQIQAPTGSPVTQIGDGQVQAPTGAPVTQIGDGQVQAPTGAPVTQIGDGQVQAPTGAPVTQIGDGQIQAPTGAPVTQIGDGQIQAPTNGSVASPTPQPYTGAASSINGAAFSFVAAVVMAVALL